MEVYIHVAQTARIAIQDEATIRLRSGNGYARYTAAVLTRYGLYSHLRDEAVVLPRRVGVADQGEGPRGVRFPSAGLGVRRCFT
jgi:hypothetical protein